MKIGPANILVDVDGVLADFVGGVCRSFGFQYFPSQFKQMNLEAVMPPAHIEHYHAHCRERVGWCAGLEWYNGAKTFVNQLHRLGEVVAVTDGTWSRTATWHHERIEWLKPRIAPDHVIFTKTKSLVRGHVLIEDNPDVLRSWEGGYLRILVDRPWNADAHGPWFRAKQYSDIVSYLERML